MATFNLLTGSLEGSIGSITGQKWKNKHVIKTKIDGRAPHNATQNASRVAFESLNRLAVDFSRLFWLEIGLDASKMLKHNAMAKFMAPVVSNHTFEPEKCLDNLPEFSFLTKFAINLDASGENLTIDLGFSPKFSDATDVIFNFVSISTTGQIASYASFTPINGAQTIPLNVQQFAPVAFVIFANFKIYGRSRTERIYGGPIVGYHYSLEEQLTGDTWIDDKPIHSRTFIGSIDIGPANNVVTIGTIAGLDKAIDITCPLSESATSYTLLPWANPADGRAWYVNCRKTGNVDITSTRITSGATEIRNVVVTVWYTKV